MKLNGRKIEIGMGWIQVRPKPRGGEWLQTDLELIKEEGSTTVVSLLTSFENSELKLDSEAALCQRVGLRFISYPVRDRCTPSDRLSFMSLAEDLVSSIRGGERAIFHCRAGLGRAPLLACAVLAEGGLEVEEAWRMIEMARGQAVPDTPEQRAWIKTPLRRHLSLDEALRNLGGDDSGDLPSYSLG